MTQKIFEFEKEEEIKEEKKTTVIEFIIATAGFGFLITVSLVILYAVVIFGGIFFLIGLAFFLIIMGLSCLS